MSTGGANGGTISFMGFGNNRNNTTVPPAQMMMWSAAASSSPPLNQQSSGGNSDGPKVPDPGLSPVSTGGAPLLPNHHDAAVEAVVASDDTAVLPVVASPPKKKKAPSGGGGGKKRKATDAAIDASDKTSKKKGGGIQKPKQQTGEPAVRSAIQYLKRYHERLRKALQSSHEQALQSHPETTATDFDEYCRTISVTGESVRVGTTSLNTIRWFLMTSFEAFANQALVPMLPQVRTTITTAEAGDGGGEDSGTLV